MLSTATFLSCRTVPTSLLLYMPHIWSITGYHSHPQIPQITKCQSGLLYTRRHFIRYVITTWDMTNEVTKCAHLTQVFPCKTNVQPPTKPISQHYFMIRWCNTHTKRDYTTTEIIGRKLLFTWVLTTSFTYSKSNRFLSEHISILLFSYEDTAISTTISITTLEWRDESSQLWGKPLSPVNSSETSP